MGLEHSPVVWGWVVLAATLHPEGSEEDPWSDLLPGEEVKWIVRGQGHYGKELGRGPDQAVDA